MALDSDVQTDMQTDLRYTQATSLSDLFAADTADAPHAFILNYPATASWAAYPNTEKYFLQDGSDEATKVSYDKIVQQEPWKNLAVLGDRLAGIVIRPPRNILIDYWREHFGFRYENLEVLQRSVYLDYLSQSDRFAKVLTLFPFDHLAPEKHAVPPDTHYRLLSKETLSELGVPCPHYVTYHLDETPLEDVPLPAEFPYLIKTTHGLSGEGTYIIQNSSDLDYCLREIRKYREINLLRSIVVSDFVKNAVQNYCMQFYVSKTGAVELIGVTGQLVTEEGGYLGGLIDYQNTPVERFAPHILAIARYAHQQGYFGIIGCDVLEDNDGQLHAIDANFRVNGSTPLCLQRQPLLKEGKAIAKYSTDYRMDGTLDSILVELRPELARKDFLILSALEKVKYGKIYTELYGIVAGETLEEMQQIEQKLQSKGLMLG
ncbi:carbamoylphosphate synthase large subunit [Thermoleptolyngbya sichuanensis XZ-Cy5]|uniref:carbamoylphosphate synthase large subunit n=1 Tax=Thermoleptolyngbya sichuanensis TaxID=2885951 RepID=UPI00240E2F1B|nr:carbamoylphosphate synthase large subunit [Thermoleptolyngbya sichuanensis]MDG2616716.1 carbamoylphosphate synthase large subunit [Thermoleptolyngbya sichuanensis XZ-Cy5]